MKPEAAAATTPSAPESAEVTLAAKGRDWTLLSAGIGGGILLGAVAWLAIWLQSPTEVKVAVNSPSAADVQQATAPNEPATEKAAAPAPAASQPLPAQEPTPAAPTSAVPAHEAATAPTPEISQPQVDAPGDANVAPAPAVPVATTAAAPTTSAPAPAAAEPAAVSASEAAAAANNTKPELRLEPVKPEPNPPAAVASADDSLGNVPASLGDAVPGSLGDSVPDANVQNDPQPAPAAGPSSLDVSAGEPTAIATAEIERRLGVKLARVDFSAVPLGHLAGFLSDVSGARVVLDEPSLAKAGKSRKTPVTVKSSGTTGLAILQAAAQQTGLDYKIEPGRITLSARDP